MIRSAKHIARLSFMFLTIFVGAFTINALCDLEIIDYASNLGHQHDEHDKGRSDHHDTMASSHQHGADHHHDTESEDDPCCDEKAASLEASLFFNYSASTIPSIKYFLLKTIDYTLKSMVQYNQVNIIYHEYDDPPPLEGFSLRVVIQSFLN